MIPALTLANLVAYSLEVAAVVAVGGAALSALRVQQPAVRLACLRAILLACLVLPFVATVPAARTTTARTGATPAAAGDFQTTVVGRGLIPGTAGDSRPPEG
ncbi:MAG: hypothetical protein ACM3NQ_04730, partial [Bacteroidales bacterium]